MKKVIALCFFLLASLACGSYASADRVDLQPNNAYVAADGYLYVRIQNNGPDNFRGLFTITTYPSAFEYSIDVKFNGSIAFGSQATVSLCKYVDGNTYSIFINSRGETIETDESNNLINFVKDEPRVEIISTRFGDIMAFDFRKTIFALPGEYFYESFALYEMNKSNNIIGLEFNFSKIFAVSEEIIFWPAFPFDEDHEGEAFNGTYKKINKDFGTGVSMEWMANSSSSALSHLSLGVFRGTTKGLEVGGTLENSFDIKIALKNLVYCYKFVSRTIKVIDRIRCDVNDDGVVDKKDLEIMIDVVANYRYDPSIPLENMYKERGTNYGAGIILFSHPDFVSNCLLNIWIHDKNDPLVQGLGIGEMMSSTTTSVAVEQVANTYSIVGNKIEITAPGANLYQITAQMPNGSVFQKTGQLSDTVSIPDSVVNCMVETINFKNEAFVTGLFGPKLVEKDLMSVYSTKFDNQLEISGSGILTVVNLRGQQVFSGKLNEESLNIPTSDWPQGMYIAKIVSQDGHTQTTKLVK